MFCIRCGKKVVTRKKAAIRCSACGFEIYDDPKPTIQVILENDKGEVLLLRRAKSPWQGMLNTPGGFVESGETAEQAARREAKEETGVTVKNIFYVGSYPDTYEYQGVRSHLLALSFWGSIGHSRVRINDESSEFLFVPKNKIPFRQIGVPSDVLGLKDYLRRFDKKKR